MAENSAIEWTDATWNVAVGCKEKSPGCAHCYAKRIVNSRMRGDFGVLQWHADKLRLPLRWRRPRRIFVNSLSDFWEPMISDAQRDQMMAVMALAARHTFQVLTKEAQAMHDYMAVLGTLAGFQRLQRAALAMGYSLSFEGHGLVPWPLPNVHLVVSAENQHWLDERLPWLLKTDAAVRGLSLEPLLGDIALDACAPGICTVCVGSGELAGDYSADDGMSRCEACHGKGVDDDNPGIDWIIAGGETGHGARPARLPWFRSVRDWCIAEGVGFCFKQHGIWREVDIYRGAIGGDWFDDIRTEPARRTSVHHVGGKNFRWSDPLHTSVLIRMKSKKQAGRILDGRTWDDGPRKGQRGNGAAVQTA